MAHSNHDSGLKEFSFSSSPEQYKHWELSVLDDEACLNLKVNPDEGLFVGTQLKLNSYDLGVDIELADAINRLRFEHPEVLVVTITSAHPQVFSSGANIYMLKKSSHAFKVNFCKYTNETRLYIEEASRYSNKKFLCAINGTAAGGGYELALACDRILLMDDKSAAVSLPEVPLLAVLPGTGGLTRVVDKRHVRKDLADVFATLVEGVKGDRAKDWGLVDATCQRSTWAQGLKAEKEVLKSLTESQKSARGIKLSRIEPKVYENGFNYQHVFVDFNKHNTATINILAPQSLEPNDVSGMVERASELWLLKAFRELDDALLRLRFFYCDKGIWQFATKGDAHKLLHAEKALYDAMKPGAHWFLRELNLLISRLFRRIDVSARTTVCLLEQDSCFSGLLAELLIASDRVYALHDSKVSMALSPMNMGLLATWNDSSRLAQRFLGRSDKLASVSRQAHGELLSAEKAFELGLVTFLLDEIDFDDEVRLFFEERASLSPDALSAMEANLRFNGPESMATKIFGRLSAWQNWVFIRKNATGNEGALTRYGEGAKAQFDFERC
jgi:benzoyl-CoA-dihydrodiol lyase